MENFFTRYKNPLVLMAVLFIQVVALATQVKRPENPRAANAGSGTRLIRVWTVTAFTPVEWMFISTGHFFRDGWHNYADLRGVRRQNRELQDEIARLQMEQVRLKQDADQARRLQALLEFKEKFVARTVAAQVIATSGTEQSRLITIDKGSHDGIRQDMAVITPDGIVGKVKEVFRISSQVLLINDHDSGAGVILESSRLQGIVKGTSLGELQITDVMADENVEAGDHVITSGGDRIFPKGLSVGTVSSAIPDRDNDPFLNIKIKPSADLNRLEEVLVVTEVAEEPSRAAAGSAPIRAADILSQRLPSVPKQDPNAPKATGTTTAASTPSAGAADKTKKSTGAQLKKENGPGAGAGNTAQAVAPGQGAETKKPTGPGTPGTAASSTGTATPTPTPKAKAAPPKKPKAPATPLEAAPQSTPENSRTDQPNTSTPTPTATPEKPPR